MFDPMVVGAVVGGAASYLSLMHHYRHELGPMTVREARLIRSLEVTPIAHAQPGLVKLVGVVGAEQTTMSYYHRTPCAALELHHYQVVASRSGVKRVLLREERHRQPFWVEDETGRIAIDPDVARIDYEVESADLENSVEEHRLRIGARVVVLGIVRRVGPQIAQPMRAASTNFERGLEFAAPPLVSWRSEPEVYPRLAPPFGGVALSAASIGMAVLGAVLRL